MPSPRSADTAGRIRTALRSYLRSDSGSAGLLVVATLLALIVANSPLSDLYRDLWGTRFAVSLAGQGLDMDLHHWVNDGLMVIFFFTIGLEVRREFSVGELTDRRRLVVPLIAGLGGMLVPAALYLAINPGGEASAGWGVVIGTDTAFLLSMLALVGPAVSSQLRVFLLTITVVDDIVAVSVIGIAYTDRIVWVPLLIAVAALIGMAILDRLDAWRAGPYVALVVIAWLATIGSGLHASIAGMLAGLLVPAALPTRHRVDAAARQFRLFRQSPLSVTQRRARDELTRTISVNERLQASLQTITSFVIVPLFAFANAGVDLRGGVLIEALRSPVTWGVVVGLVLGKALGISLGAFAGIRFGWGRLPQGVRGGHLVGGAALSGIGFTVSLLIADLAFSHEELRRDAIIGILLAAVTASLLGWIVFAFAARVLGQRDAALPTALSEPVDPERDHLRGPADAELTLVEYLDFECPFCARTTGVAREVREHFGDRLRYVVRHFPLDDVHPHSELAALGAEAAGRQGRFWDMHDVLFAHQHELELEDLAGYAGELGLDVEGFMGDLEASDLAARLAEDRRSGGASGVRGTPTFFIGDRRHEGRFDSAALIAALEESARPGGER